VSEFRPFDYLWDPTMQAATPDGVLVQTVASVLDLVRFTPIPVYVPEGEGRGMVDAEEGLDWTCVGTYGRIKAWPEAERIGIHVPDNVRLEFQDWCNAFVASHPSTPMIPRTEIAYRRNNYTTTHTCLFTYNQLKDAHDDHIRKNAGRGRSRATQQTARFDGR